MAAITFVTAALITLASLVLLWSPATGPLIVSAPKAADKAVLEYTAALSEPTADAHVARAIKRIRPASSAHRAERELPPSVTTQSVVQSNPAALTNALGISTTSISDSLSWATTSRPLAVSQPLPISEIVASAAAPSLVTSSQPPGEISTYSARAPISAAPASAPALLESTLPAPPALTPAPEVAPDTILVSLVIDNGLDVLRFDPVELPKTSKVIDLLELASARWGFTLVTEDFGALGKFIIELNGQSQDAARGLYWMYYVDGALARLGASSQTLGPGETIEWRLGKP